MAARSSACASAGLPSGRHPGTLMPPPHCLLVSQYYESEVKQRLLRYATSALLFSESRVNPQLISWNRVVLLHGWAAPGSCGKGKRGWMGLCCRYGVMRSWRMRTCDGWAELACWQAAFWHGNGAAGWLRPRVSQPAQQNAMYAQPGLCASEHECCWYCL